VKNEKLTNARSGGTLPMDIGEMAKPEGAHYLKHYEKIFGLFFRLEKIYQQRW